MYRPTCPIDMCPQPAYEPQAGDIIQKGRHRIEYRGEDRNTPLYIQSRWTGNWGFNRWEDVGAGVIAVMVRCDGWRLVYRRPQKEAQ